jgi:AhpD family alkylhydroperoxidase
MLTVTSVNRCRYCAAFHDGAARLAGASAEEAALLLHGSVGQAPPSEIPALLYALHWAERDGQPPPTLTEELASHYGAGTAAAITFALHAIRVGNLLGNSWDALLYALSGGRFGGAHIAEEHSITSRPNLHRFSIFGDYTQGVRASRRGQQRPDRAGPEEETNAYS